MAPTSTKADGTDKLEPIEEVPVCSVIDFLQKVREKTRALEIYGYPWASPWFRGEPGGVPKPLTPPVLRPPKEGYHFDENNLLQDFRRRAPVLAGMPIIPSQHETDKWLFVARHLGLPTRLLDWTEGATLALFFALEHFEGKKAPCKACGHQGDTPPRPVVWMLDPHALMKKTYPEARAGAYSLPWFDPGKTVMEQEELIAQLLLALGEKEHRSHVELPVNYAFQNVQGPWRGKEWIEEHGSDHPIPISPSHVHSRMQAQRSFFTVPGKNEGPLCDQVGGDCLKKFILDIADQGEAFRELRALGVSLTTVYPEAEALCAELTEKHINPD